jgi:hypothetical protein
MAWYFLKRKRSCGLLRLVVWWLETDVSEAVLPPSSGLKLVIREMYPLHCRLPRLVPEPRPLFLRRDNLKFLY